MADRRPLFSESSDLSDLANTPPQPTSPQRILSPTSRSRPGYTRLGSENTAVETVHEDEREYGVGDISDTFGGRSSGLGIATVNTPSGSLGNAGASPRRVSVQTIPRVPIGAKSPGTLSPPGTGDPFLGGFPKDSSAGSTPDLRRERASPRDDGGEYEEYRRGGFKGRTRSDTTLGSDFQQYMHSSDTERLRKRATPSIKSAYENDFRPTVECPTSRDFYQHRFTWLSCTILILCVFSTVFSGLFLGIALKGPRFGRRITTHGSLTSATANTLTSIMAKLIELSFVTSFVAFLGQVLSRRAFMKEQGRGITLAEMSMWRWVVQPGTLITHWEGVRYAGVTVLGVLSLLAATLATLYAPAATALVQPQLKFGDWESMLAVGNVLTAFANPTYVKSVCQTPIRSDTPEDGGSACLAIEHASQGYHNYQRYMSFWDTLAKEGNGTSDLRTRPQGFGLLYENTTITASWVEIVDTNETSAKYDRIVNNVSLAMPHSGVFGAARVPRNNIIQPEDLDGLGVYSIHASVPSPVLHALCTQMNETELAPIVYDMWPNNDTVDINTWVPTGLQTKAATSNKTVVDDLFGWDHSDAVHFPPVFGKLPKPFNTILNHTFPSYGRDSIYLLGAGGADASKNTTGEYMLCQIKVSLSPNCSTRYNATGGGGTMEAICEDSNDNLAYIKSLSNATSGVTNKDWFNIGTDWANSMSLNAGIMDGNASNSRILTQLLMAKKDDGSVVLDPALPSPAEALAVMSGCTLLMSAQDSPFVEFWNYSSTTVSPAQTQYFNASIRAQQYASGGIGTSVKAWTIVLFLVFLIDILVLLYFIFHHGLVTDFSEPPNLFTLAVNSPPSQLLAGSCGGGPEGKQYIVNWFVNAEGDHLFMEPGSKRVDHSHRRHQHQHHSATGVLGKVQKSLGELRQRGGLGYSRTLKRPASMLVDDEGVELGDANSRTRRQYDKLAKRTSML